MSTLSDTPWWTKDWRTSPPHKRLIPLVRSLQSTQQQRYVNMRKMISVYEYGFSASSSSMNDIGPLEDRRLHFNVAKNAMDTMHAQVCTPKISPMLLTEGGTKGQRDRAKMATRAIEGVFDENDMDELKEDVTLDGQLAYCGFAKVFSRICDDHEEGENGYGEIKIERVIPEDVLVDDSEGRNRKPRCMFQRAFEDRYVLLASYGESGDGLYGSAKLRAEKISKAKSGSPTIDDFAQNTDRVEIWEAWHLPSSPIEYDEAGDVDPHDGLHVIAIDGCTLLVEPWDRDRFPFAVYRPEKARQGFWGLSAMRQAMAGQREYEKITEKLQRAHAKMGSSSIIASRGSNVNTREIGNGQGQIIECDGSPEGIRDFTPTPANEQTYRFRESIADDVLRYLGISGFASQSEIPSGMTNASGKALTTLSNAESKRGILRHRATERFIVDVSDLVLDEARSLIRDGVRVTSRSRDKTGFTNIDWKDIVEVLEDRKNYVVKTFPIGALSQEPAEKFAQLDALLDRQVITIDQFKRLYEIPDLEAENSVDMADTEIIDKNIDHMVTKGRYLSPQSFDNLQLIIERAGKIYNAYRIAEVPDARLELIRRYITDAKAMIDDAATKAAAMASGPPGMPMREGMGPPMPPPPMDPMGGPMQQMSIPLDAGPPMQGPPMMNP